jgi:hypothetical protein
MNAQDLVLMCCAALMVSCMSSMTQRRQGAFTPPANGAIMMIDCQQLCIFLVVMCLPPRKRPSVRNAIALVCSVGQHSSSISSKKIHAYHHHLHQYL